MTTDEIFGKTIAHMIKGVMVHGQLADYFSFLALHGYGEEQKYHFIDESLEYRDISEYYIDCYNKLPQEMPVDNPNMIPSNWYNHSRQDVDANTKKSAIDNGMSAWVSWEHETLKFYEAMYEHLIELSDISSAIKIQNLIEDVEHEVVVAERYTLNKQELSDIISEQDNIYDKFHKKIKRLL